jgi:hypothetical protein
MLDNYLVPPPYLVHQDPAFSLVNGRIYYTGSSLDFKSLHESKIKNQINNNKLNIKQIR